jgi:miniconductance mechanosensitive channel
MDRRLDECGSEREAAVIAAGGANMQALTDWLTKQGLAPEWSTLLVTLAAGLVVLLLALAAHFLARRILMRGVRRVVERTQSQWDDAFLRRKAFDRLAHLAPAIVLHTTAPLVFGAYPTVVSLVETGATIYMALVGLLVVNAVLNAGLDIYETFEISRRIYIKGFVQVLKITLSFVVGVFVVARLLGESPIVFFSGLGAFTAVLILVFKDSILGLVAGVQLMGNSLVRRGDWIQMKKSGVDGDVLDVSLMTVTVQNWDKTIVTVPTYSLVSEGFHNWRGMEDSGGRRIKRAVIIDMNTIRFCDAEMLGRFKRVQYIHEYIDRKLEEVARYNRDSEVDESVLINGRRLTNVGTFRAYLEAYLRNHPMVHSGLTFLVRHLAPTAQGLPIEIYVFSREQRWAHYEAIQADIFDHVLAAVPLFDLRVFQSPSGVDVQQLTAAASRSDSPV